MHRKPIQEFKAQRIAGAKFFDLDGKFSDTNSPYPHMLPTADNFWKSASEIGVEKGDFIVAYDSVRYNSKMSDKNSKK